MMDFISSVTFNSGAMPKHPVEGADERNTASKFTVILVPEEGQKTEGVNYKVVAYTAERLARTLAGDLPAAVGGAQLQPSQVKLKGRMSDEDCQVLSAELPRVGVVVNVKGVQVSGRGGQLLAERKSVNYRFKRPDGPGYRPAEGPLTATSFQQKDYTGEQRWLPREGVDYRIKAFARTVYASAEEGLEGAAMQRYKEVLDASKATTVKLVLGKECPEINAQVREQIQTLLSGSPVNRVIVVAARWAEGQQALFEQFLQSGDIAQEVRPGR